MVTDENSFLPGLDNRLKLDSATKEEILRELQSHLEDKAADLETSGLPRDQAYNQALTALGQPDRIAKDMYAVHSNGSWLDIFLATLPHLLLAALFALHLWTKFLVVLILLSVITFVAFRGWRTGRSKWAYSWLGYSLAAPTISWLMALLAIGYGAWTLMTTGVLPFSIPMLIIMAVSLPFCLWVIVSVAIKIIRRDWLLASLTALPFPFLMSWILFFNFQRDMWAPSSATVQDTDADRAVVFLALAVTTAVFLKVGHRLIQISLLTVSTVFLVMYTLAVIPLSFSLFAIILLGLSSAALLLSPALLESRLGKKTPICPVVRADQEVVTHWFVNAG